MNQEVAERLLNQGCNHKLIKEKFRNLKIEKYYSKKLQILQINMEKAKVKKPGNTSSVGKSSP